MVRRVRVVVVVVPRLDLALCFDLSHTPYTLRSDPLFSVPQTLTADTFASGGVQSA
jgi:hypothetical protein